MKLFFGIFAKVVRLFSMEIKRQDQETYHKFCDKSRIPEKLPLCGGGRRSTELTTGNGDVFN